jgi:ribosomal protein S18 acetylase RimI-like enzyme
MTLDPPLRPALIEDAPILAELVNYAGDGLPLHLWSKMAAAGESAWEVGRRRAARPEGGFSYRNAIIIEHRGTCAGCLIGYEIQDQPEPIGSDLPAMFVPLQELENLAPGTWYVNVLAVRPQFRGLGLGTRLLDVADETGRARQARHERHRVGHQSRRAAALPALRLSRGGRAGDGEGRLAERRAQLGAADQGAVSPCGRSAGRDRWLEQKNPASSRRRGFQRTRFRNFKQRVCASPSPARHRRPHTCFAPPREEHRTPDGA